MVVTAMSASASARRAKERVCSVIRFSGIFLLDFEAIVSLGYNEECLGCCFIFDDDDGDRTKQSLRKNLSACIKTLTKNECVLLVAIRARRMGTGLEFFLLKKE